MRGVSADRCSKVANALYAGGVRLMEITYNQKEPASWQQIAETIGALTEEFGEKMFFGAGTVTSVELVELTHAYGGKYIISPDTNVDVIKRTVGLGIGGNFAKKAWIDAGEFDKLTEAAKTMVEIIKSVQ